MAVLGMMVMGLGLRLAERQKLNPTLGGCGRDIFLRVLCGS